MPAHQLRELAKALQERSIPLVSDEVFHRLYFGPAEPSAACVPGSIVVGDMSKCLSLPGLRVGWIIDADPKRGVQLIEIRDHLSVSGSPLMESFASLALKEQSRILEKLASGARSKCANGSPAMTTSSSRMSVKSDCPCSPAHVSAEKPPPRSQARLHAPH